MPEYTRTIDCEKWAKQRITKLSLDQHCLYVIKPIEGQCLDRFRIVENNILVKVDTKWTHHFVVLHDGIVYDEHHQDGIPVNLFIENNIEDSGNVIAPAEQEWEKDDPEPTI